MKKTAATYLHRSQTLLELAQSNSGSAQIRWRSADRGSWELVNPRWKTAGGKIRFEFRDGKRLLAYPVASVRQTAYGVDVFLSTPGNPIPEPLRIAWQQRLPDPADTCGLWKIAKYWLSSRFPGHRILRAAKRSDLARTLSGAFLRVYFRHRGRDSLLIAADEDSEEEIHTAAGQALLWVSIVAAKKRSSSLPIVYILVPSGASAVLFHRCRFLNKDRIKAEVWEYQATALDPHFHRAPAPPEPEENKDFRWPVLGPFHWSSPLQRVLDLAPALIRRYPRFQDYDSLRLWGLEFAQAIGPERDRIVFGVGPQRTELNECNFELLRTMVEEMLYFRRPDSPDTRHPYYKLQAERWLEALVLEDIPRLFPEMQPESVYSQIPVYLGPDSGRIDILGADRHGTLVVMELKVAADPDLPMQALDYWGRVIQHNKNGDFERRGYFSGIRLMRRHPKIYLVSPVFSFHDTTESLLQYLDPELEVWKISVNEDWRCGVRIIRRLQFRCPKPE